MESAQFEAAQIAKDPRNANVNYGDDSRIIAEFYTDAVYLEHQSIEENKPCFVDQVFCRMRFPGDKTKVVVEKLQEKDSQYQPGHPRRFPDAWRQFKNQEAQIPNGTPLSELQFLTKAQVLNFKAIGLFTVEQFAAVSDQQLDGLGLGARAIRDQASNYLAKAQDGAHLPKLVKENAEMKDEIARLQASVKELAALLQSATEPNPSNPTGSIPKPSNTLNLKGK